MARTKRRTERADAAEATLRAPARRRLLAWYDRQRRDLPWRRTRDPYRIWVSEVMLQQTTVRTALPHYEAFVERFPDVTALAAASLDDVLASWSGLGYYHRARNLHRAAKVLADKHGGRFPRRLPEALALPGVGLYTASAVLSIAHGVALPVVDGNVRRVLARLFELRGEDGRNEGRLYCRAEELLDTQRPGDWNQALMELGATVCTPKKPACAACPIATSCRGLAAGAVEELPEAKRRRPSVDVTVAAAFVEERGRLLLVRRGEGPLLARFWELPQTSLESKGRRDLEREALAGYGLKLQVGPLVAQARHSITFRRIRAEAYRARLAARPVRDAERVRWAGPEDLSALAVSTLTRKLVRALGKAQLPLPIC